MKPDANMFLEALREAHRMMKHTLEYEQRGEDLPDYHELEKWGLQFVNAFGLLDEALTTGQPLPNHWQR